MVTIRMLSADFGRGARRHAAAVARLAARKNALFTRRRYTAAQYPDRSLPLPARRSRQPGFRLHSARIPTLATFLKALGYATAAPRCRGLWIARHRPYFLREPSDEPQTLVLAATDPANPYGAAIGWPEREGARPQRVAGAQVVLADGRLVAWIGRAERNLLTFLPESDPERMETARAIALALASLVTGGRRRALLVAKIDGEDPAQSDLAVHLREAGFLPGSRGYLKRTPPREPEESAVLGLRSRADEPEHADA
jgi:hypothetical protein